MLCKCVADGLLCWFAGLLAACLTVSCSLLPAQLLLCCICTIAASVARLGYVVTAEPISS